MSEFTQEQQTEIVGDAMQLTAAIISEESELETLRSERFRSLPNPPTHQVLGKAATFQPQYPAIPKTKYSYSQYLKEGLQKNKKKIKKIVLIIVAIIVALSILSIIISKSAFGISSIIFTAFYLVGFAVFPFLIVTFSRYNTKRKAMNEELAKSPEYLKAVADAEKLAADQQKAAEEKQRTEQEKLDAKYKKEKDEYDNVTVPEYNREKELWKVMQQKKISLIENDLKVNNDTLNELYAVTKLIPPTYREINLLIWLYEDMRATDHDIRYATELLDRDRQRAATAAVTSSVRNMDQNMRQGFGAVYAAIEEGNEIQYETLATLESTNKLVSKTRRDMNIGSLVGTVQRNKTNKLLSGE